MPTETVYGLAADASNASAVAAIYAAKGRPAFNPLIAHVADLAAAQRVARLDARAVKLAQAFWPGPLTIVAPIADSAAVCDLARAGLDTVAVRVPAHPLARAVLAAGVATAPAQQRLRMIEAHAQLATLTAQAPTYNYDPGLLAMEIGGLLASAAMPKATA